MQVHGVSERAIYEMVPVNGPGEDESWAYLVPEAELHSLEEQLQIALTERDAIGAALGEPCAECGHIDWRSDGYADSLLASRDELLTEADAQAARYETTIQRLEEQLKVAEARVTELERYIVSTTPTDA